MRIDRALTSDLRAALGSWPVRSYLLLQLAAATVFLARRGPGTLETVLLIWVGLSALAFTAWWAGRHRLAHPRPDVVPAAWPRSILAMLGVAGMTLWGFGVAMGLGLVLVALGIGGWSWTAIRAGKPTRIRERLLRSPRPFVPLLLLVGLPKLLAIGPPYIVGAALAMPSGIGQQVLFLIGLFGPLEAATGRPAVAAIAAALAFALVHVPFVLQANGGDALASVANALLFQANVAVIATLAYRRHRAVIPIGITHALAIG